jgi:transcriptional regulator with XRE-family HTH domain
MGIDLKKLTAKQALGLAKSLSGMSNEELAEKMEQDHSSVKRYFNEQDKDYYPSLMRIPKLCQALGNSILLDWLNVQVEGAKEPSDSIKSDNDLLRRMNRLAVELGDVHRTVDDSLSGSGLEEFDPKRLLSELFEVEHLVKEFRHGLQHASGERLESRGWKTAVAKGD